MYPGYAGLILSVNDSTFTAGEAPCKRGDGSCGRERHRALPFSKNPVLAAAMLGTRRWDVKHHEERALVGSPSARSQGVAGSPLAFSFGSAHAARAALSGPVRDSGCSSNPA